MSEFYQEPPRLGNTYTSHRWLGAYLRHKLPAQARETIEPDLVRLGGACAGEYLELARSAERDKPQLIAYEPWGRRVDEIRVSPAWRELHAVSAREGMVAIGYERAFGEHSRVYQFAKLYLFHPSSAFFTCPLAMADGAAKALERFATLPEHDEALAHLLSRDPAEFWTSGQWMTERSGGSDVSGTATVARVEGGQTRLYGTKFFTSSPVSQMALALARGPQSPPGSQGLTLFYLPMRLSGGGLNHLRVHRLKEKLGTWALPTAEITLEGSIAHALGDPNRGVKTVATMLNITRLYNSICSVGQMTRALAELRDHSQKRIVFGSPLDRHVLHVNTFALEEVKLMAGFLLTMELAHLLGKEECETADAAELDVLRLMTPVCKLFTARSAVQTASEVVEGFGGAGYVEDTGIPGHLRDSQVFPIWEGATNVLSLDMLRVLQKGAAMAGFKENVAARLKALRSPEVAMPRDQILTRLHGLELRLSAWSKATAEEQAGSCRDLAFHLAWLYAAVAGLAWLDHETPENKRALAPWITQILKCAGDWKPRDAEELLRAREIWQTTLKT